MEKRESPRVLFKTTAEVTSGDAIINGIVENLNTKGMFLTTTERLKENQSVEVTIHLSGTTTELSITLKGTVLRNDPRGMALKFTEMELDCFVHLRNIVMYAESAALVENH